MKARRVMDAIEVLIATVDDDADWDNPWDLVVFAGLRVARQAAVAARYKGQPKVTSIDQLIDAYEKALDDG